MVFGQLTNSESFRDMIVVIEALRSKCYHLGLGKNVTISNLAKANQNRNCRIFKEFATFFVAEARSKRITILFGLGGSVYAFDTATIYLYLSVFWWAKFRKRKGGIKIHTLYDIETQMPTFFHITKAAVNDIPAMDKIPYESGSYNIFDLGYNDFRITCKESFFAVRAKSNLQYKAVKWRRRLPKNVLSDA